MKETKFPGLVDAKVNVKISSFALTEGMIGSFPLVLSFFRQLTNQNAPFHFFTLLSGNNISFSQSKRRKKLLVQHIAFP